MPSSAPKPVQTNQSFTMEEMDALALANLEAARKRVRKEAQKTAPSQKK